MYATRTTQLIVGVFAILGIAALGILSISLGKISIFPSPGYTLYASFDNISGLKTGDQVQLNGVQVGKVVQIGLKDNRARIALRVDDGVPIDKDAIASCKTSGIIGDKYVSIQLGPSDRELRNGDTIRQTESCFILEDAIGQLINSSGSSNSSDKDKSSSPDSKGSNSNCNCTDNNAAKQPGQSGKAPAKK
jgi:phospholipid/cholesterol/gamma-HCH transport system substrate-binding protein